MLEYYNRDTRSLEFTVTRSFMKLFQTGSAAIVIDCQIFFHFLPVTYQIDIPTAKFLNKFLASKNSICTCILFENYAQARLNNSYSNDIGSVPDLCHADYESFFEGKYCSV